MVRGRSTLHPGAVQEVYDDWPPPDLIVSDGAYGVGGFPGDPRTPDGLEEWYAEHVVAWSKHAHPATTLWFWNTEIGWATVHPLLAREGWEYVQTILWDKRDWSHRRQRERGHDSPAADRDRGLCLLLAAARVQDPDGTISACRRLRAGWQRTGMPLYRANEACGMKNAATRKYLTQDWLWYFPPAEMTGRLVTYANEHGDPAGRPSREASGHPGRIWTFDRA